jgi:hypothetical protein
MTRNSIDVASRVSPHLSALLSSRINNSECEQPVTLMAVRRFLGDLLPEDFKEAERLHHFDVSESVLDELDALIEEFGAGALAIDFAQVKASEPLSRAIEAVAGDGLVAELCRMLGASPDDEGARRHAEELLERRTG